MMLVRDASIPTGRAGARSCAAWPSLRALGAFRSRFGRGQAKVMAGHASDVPTNVRSVENNVGLFTIVLLDRRRQPETLEDSESVKMNVWIM